VQALLQRHNVIELSPLLPEKTLATLSRTAIAGAPDMASWYHLTLPAAADVDKALADLTASPAVQWAYPAPEAAPPPATPDFTSMQGYQRPAPPPPARPTTTTTGRLDESDCSIGREAPGLQFAAC